MRGGGGNSPHSLESHPVIASDSEAIHNTESKIDCHSPKGLRNDNEEVDCHALPSDKARNDNGADSEDKEARRQDLDSRDSRAEAVEMRKQGEAEVSLVNRGFQGGGEGVTKAVMTEKGNAESTIYRSNATPQEPDIVLDFFAGSGTTAHAVMELNAQDGGKRKYILVQLDEAIDESKAKTAYDFCKNELGSKKPVISDITIERVKRASSRILESHKGAPLELGFRVFSMVEKPSLISDELGSLKLRWRSELSPRDKARNLSLFDNKMLHLELQEIIKDSLYQCEQSFYIVALNDEVLAYLRESESEEVYISGYDIASLQSYKNLESLLTSRLKVVY